MREALQMIVSIGDAAGTQREIPRPIRRIVSLVPSITETLFELGLDEEVVGITRFCTHPKEKVRDKERVGGPRDPDLAKIVRLKPDLVLMNREENRLEDLRYLEKRAPVYVEFPRTPEEAAEGIEILGLLAGREEKGRALARLVREEIAASRAWAAKRQTKRVVYLVWRRPYLAAGPDSYASALLRLHGLVNEVPAGAERYPRVPVRRIASLDPDLILLPTEPYRFRPPHAVELARALARASSGEEWPEGTGLDAGTGDVPLGFPFGEGEREGQASSGGAAPGTAGTSQSTGVVLPFEGAGKGGVEKGSETKPEDPEAVARWEGRIRLIDGACPTWHGYRMSVAMPYLRRFLEEVDRPVEAKSATG